jgi:hypothetical protein
MLFLNIEFKLHASWYSRCDPQLLIVVNIIGITTDNLSDLHHRAAFMREVFQHSIAANLTPRSLYLGSRPELARKDSHT